MFTRIVKMTFDPSKLDTFLHMFEEVNQHIRNVEGCQHLQLLADKKHSNILFTYSIWESDEALARYRHSDLFKSVWAKTKIHFAAAPEAWSLNSLKTVY